MRVSFQGPTDHGGGKRRAATKTGLSTLVHSREQSLHWRRVNIELVGNRQSGTDKVAHTKCADACAPPFRGGSYRCLETNSSGSLAIFAAIRRARG
jgi:hypothetical protein